MKTKPAKVPVDLRPEYDFASLPGGIRGKYAERFQRTGKLVLLAPDVAQVFHDEKSVNEALRSLIQLARTQVPPAKP